MKMFAKEFVACFVFVCVGLSVGGVRAGTSSAPSPSQLPASGGQFKENEILRDRDSAGGEGRARAAPAKQTDVDRSRKFDSVADKIDDENENDAFELIDSGSDEDGDEPSIEAGANEPSLKQQVRLLAAELRAHRKKQQSDYQTLESHVRKSVRKAAKQFAEQQSLRTELEQLR